MCFGEGKELKKFGKFLLVLNLFFLLACASQKDLDRLRLALYTQQQENQQLKQEVVNLQTKLQEITATLQQKIEQSATPVRSAQANLWAEIESLRKSLASLSGEIDEIKYSLAKDKESSQNLLEQTQELQNKVAKLEGLVATLESNLGLNLEKPTSSSSKTQTPALLKTSSPEELYQQALNAFYQRKYDLAQTLWEQFIQEYPKHKLVSNALFWKGECLYQKEDYKRAILAYQEVIDKYPKSNKIAAAYLKEAISFAQIKKKKAATLLLKELIQKFPKTTEAERAKAFLAELEKE